MSSAKRVRATPLFSRKAKKLSRQAKGRLDEEVRKLADNPSLGEEKRGDLHGVRVHKYRAGRDEMLLAYEDTPDALILLALGTHENYYRDLKKYRKG